MLNLLITCVLTSISSAGTAADAEPIWQIGRSNNTYAELAIPSQHQAYTKTFPSDVIFRAGKDEPDRAWPFIHPGPADAWAGGKTHTFRIVFNLDKPVEGRACLIVDLVDTHSGAPPLVEIEVNGQTAQVQVPRGAGDASLERPAAGREYVIRLPMTGDLLRKGENMIQIKSIGGSWMLYDAVRLEPLGGTDPAAAVQAQAGPFVLKSPSGPVQQLDVRIDACGSAGQLELTVDGKTCSQPVPERKLGSTTIMMSIPPVKAPAKGQLVLKTGGKAISTTIDLRPVRPWQVFLVQHTHSDVGYPDTQASLAARLVDYIDAALDYVEQTKDYPDDAKFRWTCEATWSDDLFLQTRGRQRIDALRKAIAEGRIELAAMPMNMTDLATEEVLIHELQIIARLRRELGAKVLTAMQNDVNGYALSLPRLLAGCGVKYFSTGINRTRSLVPFDRPTGLYWESPDGASVLTWRGEHYMAGNYFTETTDPARVSDRLAGYLAGLEGGGYPHSAVLLQLSGYHTDDAWPSPGFCDLVKNWNERFVWPKLRVATISEFFKAIEAESADKLPHIRKAWCDWWADGNGSAVQEVSMIRETHELLESALTILAASADKKAFPELPSKIAHAFRRTLMFDEHTWGFAGSISQPESWMTKAQWGYKSAQAYEASLLTASIYDAAREAGASGIPTTGPSIVVQNPSSWPRGGVQVFRIPAPATYGRKAFRLVDVATGKPVALQSLGRAPIYDSTYAVDVPPVPALGYRVFRIEDAAPEPDLSTDLKFAGKAIENEYYWVEIDPKTGTLFSLRDKKTDRELVGKGKYGLLQYVYEQPKGGRGMFWPPRKDLDFDRAVPTSVSVTKGHDGPLAKSLRISSKIAEGHRIQCELMLYRRTPRVDVRLTIHKPSATNPEAGYLAFPLALREPVFDLDAVGGTFQPGPGQIDRTASDYHSIQRYVRVSEGAEKGLDVVVASLATPLVQIGDIHVGQYQERLTKPGPLFYMWLFNNYWFTNFPASQGGELQFAFAMTSRPHGDDAVSSAHRFGVDVCTPMPIAYLPKGQGGGHASNQAGIVEVSPAGVMITGMTWARQGEGVIVRLREFDGKAAKARVKFNAPWKVEAAERVNLLEEVQGKLPVSGGSIEVDLGPLEMATIRLTPSRS
ncbi:MAG: hypothetical protein JXQ73_00235 [Phycisphaerae bacterium]|nr:hypothetical protein [Phycisphaerae bacterium]